MKIFIVLLFLVGLTLGKHDETKSVKKYLEASLEDRLVNGLNNYMKTGKQSSDLRAAFEEVKSTKKLRFFDDSVENAVVCTLCNVAARVLLTYRQNGGTQEMATKALKVLCISSGLETPTVCNGALDLNIGIFFYIADTYPGLTPAKICSIIAQPFGCHDPNTGNEWNVSIPPHLAHPPSLRASPRHKRPFRIMQITDVHFDELYAPGANALCTEPLCCGTNQGEPQSPSAMAGTWGDYRSCDMPWYSVLNLMKQVQIHFQDIDFMYFTGDIINHRVWATSVSNNVKNIKKLYSEIKNVFKHIPVYPILGNHEPNPLNEFAPESVTSTNLTTKWLYELVAEEWAYWLPNSTMETIRKGGYYTVLARPGFRIIALNSNVAYTFNWWLLLADKDPLDQLQWLTDTLQQAEKDGEIVHILSHVPTGDNTCYRAWAYQYGRIIQRFAHIIAAQFVGHTHYDEMNLYFNNSNLDEPISIAYNGGSFTTYINLNPDYRIYDIDTVTWEVEDYEEWIYNLTAANEHSTEVPPVWYKLYSFKEAYGTDSMSLPKMADLVRRMSNNQTLLDKYFRYKVRVGDASLLDGCNQQCHETNLCNLVTTEYGNNKLCKDLVAAYKQSLSKSP